MRPDDLYPIAIALGVLTGRVALYCPTDQYFKNKEVAARLLPVIGWLIDQGAITPMGSKNQLDQFWPEPITDIPASFIEVEAGFHREWAKEKALTIDPQFVRLPKTDLAPDTIQAAMRQLNLDDERRGFVYTIATEAAVCQQKLFLSSTQDQVICSPLLPSTWLRCISPQLTQSLSTGRPEHRFAFNLLESSISIAAKEIRQHACEFATSCTSDDLRVIRKEFQSWEDSLHISGDMDEAELAVHVRGARQSIDQQIRNLTKSEKKYHTFVKFFAPIEKIAIGVLSSLLGPGFSLYSDPISQTSSGLMATLELWQALRYRLPGTETRWMYRLFGLV